MRVINLYTYKCLTFEHDYKRFQVNKGKIKVIVHLHFLKKDKFSRFQVYLYFIMQRFVYFIRKFLCCK